MRCPQTAAGVGRRLKPRPTEFAAAPAPPWVESVHLIDRPRVDWARMAVPARALRALRLPVPPDKPQPRAVFPRHALVAPRLQLVAANTSTRRATDSSRVSQQYRLPPTSRILFHHTEAHGALIDWNSGVEPRPTAMFQRSACFQRVHKPSNSPQIVALSHPPLLFWRAWAR